MKKFNYKWLLSLVALVFWGITGQAQPPNDLCPGAFPISSGQTISGTTTGATIDSPNGLTTCGTAITSAGVWYFIVGNGGPLTASTCNQASYDTKISIFSGTCGSLSCEGGNDDGAGCSGFTSEITVNTNPGTLYYILVHGFGGASGAFDLTATLGSPPSGNDVCGGALPIVCGQTASGTTVGTTFDNVGTCGTTNSAPGVWYTTVGNGDIYVATTCSGTSYDSKISVFEGNCGNLQCVDGNDDDCGLQSTVSWNSTPGTQYFILVHGFGTSTGSFDLGLSCIQLAQNDAPCGAVALNYGDNNYAHIGYSADAGEVDPGAGTGSSSCNSTDGWCSFETDVDNSAWFSFVAPAGGSVTVVAEGFDSQIGVYTASDCNDYTTFSEVGGNDDSGDDFSPNAGIFDAGLQLNCLTPGETYYVQVDGFNGDNSATANVVLTDNQGTLPTVDAGDCQSRYVGYAPAEADSNFLYANGTGTGELTFTWTVVTGDPTIFFQEDDGGLSIIAVQPNQTTTYEVTVTDENGCSATDQVVVNFVDVSCGNNGNKVLVCHVPPGNPANAHNICIAPQAVGAHVDPSYGQSDSYIGPCGNTCRATNPSIAPPPACVDLVVEVTTDDFASETSWEIVESGTSNVIGSRQFTFSDDFTTFRDTFCVDPRDCYDVNIADSFGDGICCSFGTGNWSVTFDGTTTVSPTSGAYGSGETISVGNCSNKGSQAQSLVSENLLKVAVYPNPSSTLTHFKFSSPEGGNVEVAVYNLQGTQIATVFNGQVEAGVAQMVDLNASELASGVYMYRATSNGQTTAGKFQVVH